MIFNKIFILLICLFISSNLYADIDFHFLGNVHFVSNVNIIPGKMESFEVEENSDIKLLVGYFSDKNFVQVARSSSDFKLKSSFLSSSEALDSINAQSGRQLVGFKKFTRDGNIVIQLKYTLIKNNQVWNEADSYFFNETSSSMASLQFPDSLQAQQKIELLNGLDNIQITNATPLTVFLKIKAKILNMLATSSIIQLSISDSIAAETADCKPKGFAQTNVYAIKTGSAIYNIGKLVSSIEEETRNISADIESNKTPNDTNLKCIINLYKATKNNAVDYWAKQGVTHNCFNDSDSMKSTSEISNLSKTDQKVCNDIVNGRKYLGRSESDLKKFLAIEEADYRGCKSSSSAEEKGLVDLANVAAHAEKSFCCSPKEGPLYKILESDYIKKHDIKAGTSEADNNALIKECNSKYSAIDKPGQSFLSADGFGDCVQNFMEGGADLIMSAISALSALTDFATIKALGQLVAGLPSSAMGILKMMGEQIATKAYAATNCMSPYDAKQFVCKMVPEVAALLFGPGLIKKFAQAIVEKASTTALAQIIAKGVSESTKLKKLGAMTAKAGAAVSKVAKPIVNSKFLKPKLEVLGKVKNFLNKDVSTPVKDLLKGKIQKARAAANEAKAAEATAAVNASVTEEINKASAAQKALDNGKSSGAIQTTKVANPINPDARLTTAQGKELAQARGIPTPNTAATIEKTKVVSAEPTPQPKAQSTVVDPADQRMIIKPIDPEARLTTAQGEELRKAMGIQTSETASTPAPPVSGESLSNGGRRSAKSTAKVSAQTVQQNSVNIDRAINSGNPQLAAKLIEDDMRASGHSITAEQSQAILKAHTDPKAACVVGQCSSAQLAEKARIMDAAGLDKNARRSAMERGWAGKWEKESLPAANKRFFSKDDNDKITQSRNMIQQKQASIADAEERVKEAQAKYSKSSSAERTVAREKAQLVDEQARVAHLLGETRGIAAAKKEFKDMAPTVKSFTNTDTMKKYLSGVGGNQEAARFQGLLKNGSYSGLDNAELGNILDAGLNSGTLGKSALRNTENALSQSIKEAAAGSDTSGLKAYQAYGDARARMVVYERRYADELRVANGGKLPNNWEDTIRDSTTFQQYSSELESLAKKSGSN